MSDPRYAPGVLAGIKLSQLGGIVNLWPAKTRFGVKVGHKPFARCSLCAPGVPAWRAWTYGWYGETPLCLQHARESERE